MSAAAILAQTPNQIFPDQSSVAAKFKALAAQWHPDKCKDPLAGDVFAHILKARNVALGKSDQNRLVLTRKKGTPEKFSLDYLRERVGECGRIFMSPSAISYLIRPDMSDLADLAVKRKWVFPSKKIELEMTKYLPRSIRTEITTEGEFLAYRRDPDQILLRDFIEYQQRHGQLDHRHVMWIVSSLLNTCCYLEVTKTSHCGLTPDYMLINPTQHTVSLTGPPLYATPWGHRPKAVPKSVLALFPRMRSPDFKTEDSRVDLTSVRRLAADLLGVRDLSLVRKNTTLHPGLRDWLASPVPKSAVADYLAWEKYRGKRAFTAYPATAQEINLDLR